MGIEPTLTPRPELENKRLRVKPVLKCDSRVNFRGTWGHVGTLTVSRYVKCEGEADRPYVSTLGHQSPPSNAIHPKPWMTAAVQDTEDHDPVSIKDIEHGVEIDVTVHGAPTGESPRNR
jgi:hypothetical protein